MKHALSLAHRGLGLVAPNPAVGCVIVAENRVVGRGWTAPGGRPHAEVRALGMAGKKARGATAFVTLEPCAHTGKTPPCTGALIGAGVARVVSALEDVDARVAGRGHAQLEAAGIEVVTGVCAAEATALNLGFFLKVEAGRPMLTLKLASSFDGRIATETGESQWITGPTARRHVHMERARHDAVLVGAGTARADDPALTVRLPGPFHQPTRIVVSKWLDLPLTGQLARTAGEIPVLLVHGPGADAERRAAWISCGAECIEVPLNGHGQPDPAAMLSALGERGLTRVYCEGGGTLAAALLAADLVDRISGYSAGVMLGAGGVPSLGALGFGTLSEAPRFRLTGLKHLGGDVFHSWARPDPAPSEAPVSPLQTAPLRGLASG